MFVKQTFITYQKIFTWNCFSMLWKNGFTTIFQYFCSTWVDYFDWL